MKRESLKEALKIDAEIDSLTSRIKALTDFTTLIDDGADIVWTLGYPKGTYTKVDIPRPLAYAFGHMALEAMKLRLSVLQVALAELN